MKDFKIPEVDIRDRIRGCLIAGAAGDALGYAVEFLRRDDILHRYGPRGITRFMLSPRGRALVSDDTQMTLFTANAMLMGLTRGAMRGIGGAPERYVEFGYIDWYKTQGGVVTGSAHTWLRDLPQMQYRRAPGTTCMSACQALASNREVKNNSKGCGGLMRVAPMGLLAASYKARNILVYDDREVAEAGAYVARVTHLHPLGFLPAAMMTSLLFHIAGNPGVGLKAAVEYSITMLHATFPGEFPDPKAELEALTRKAMELAASEVSDAEAIARLGEGWTADETWAIALFCALRYAHSPREALIAAVNHDGDSDSTGSICGNILGAIHGYDALLRSNLFCPEGSTLPQILELHDIILALADDLSTGCIISEYDPRDTPQKQQWFERYCLHQPSGLEA